MEELGIEEKPSFFPVLICWLICTRPSRLHLVEQKINSNCLFSMFLPLTLLYYNKEKQIDLYRTNNKDIDLVSIKYWPHYQLFFDPMKLCTKIEVKKIDIKW